jgi:hypothetical protein
MKLYAKLFIFLAIFISDNAYAEKVQTYRNNNLGFEISYLTNWIEAKSSGNSVFFIKRKQVDEPATISINVAKYSADEDSFAHEMKKYSNKFVLKAKKRFPDAGIIENGDTYLGGFPAYYHIITYTLKI